ncbi:MAG TPA: FAD binding domain-containing protein, partial [Armatimonadota bacterium]|nr:FAD binding domain-containing protein [Armatimonadota bacterium]
MWQSYFQPASVVEALELLAKYGKEARVINGGTDLLIEMERKVRTPSVVVDISRIAGLDEVRLEDGMFHLGPGVTHNQVAGNKLLVEHGVL